MIDERSYGIIPLIKGDKGYKVLLVKLSSGNHWSFPKGRAEALESPKETAERELFEETGLSVYRYISENSITETYHVQRGGAAKSKRVDYFIAEVKGDIVIQTEEILEYILVDPHEVNDWLTHDAAKNVWNEAKGLIALMKY